ncbi:transposable element p transposase [Plakobranchus ocellatus]|uniref:Transposable element p transposase n=1 Tax=Plakobranchus ocellatus TaxID=259542 RepID=A0AAV4CMX5_9GAST|nr:transposable element p transposase [Plakobranchus ocellatus]
MEKFEDVEDTAIFINKVLTWWKILNVKSQYMDVRKNDHLQAAIGDPNDERLETILNFGNMALQMARKQGKRQKQLTRDTAQAIFHTCNGLISLCRHLLSTSHQYVLLGQFSTDPLEKEFSKLHQGSGGTYFVNVQQIVEKTNINKAKLLLNLKTDIMYDEPGHACSNCDFAIESDEKACEAVDSLEILESSVPTETKSVLVYIAGYVTRKDTSRTNLDRHHFILRSTDNTPTPLTGVASKHRWTGHVSGQFSASSSSTLSKIWCAENPSAT